MNQLWEDLCMNYRAMMARAYARIVGMNREPSWIAFELLLPLLNVAAFVFVFKALKSPTVYLGYVILGGSMIGFWMNVLWGMASQLYWEKERGQLELVLIAPFSRMALLLGMALGGMYSTGVRATFTFLVGVLVFNIPVSVSSWSALVLTFIATLLALYGLGMLGSSVFLMFGRNAWHLSNLLQEPIFLFSGFYFPVKSLGIAIASVASVIPITLGLDAMRQILFSTGSPPGFLPLSTEIWLLFLLSLIYIIAAHKALNFVERRARMEGRLTLRWQ